MALRKVLIGARSESVAVAHLTEEDLDIISMRHTVLCRGVNWVSLDKFLGYYHREGRLWDPEWRHGEARAYVTCQVRGLW